MSENVRPVVVVSRCLEFAKCRYDGAVIPDSFVARLNNYVRFKKVCPELEIGLGVPRDPVLLVKRRGKQSLVQPSTGKVLTDRMASFSAKYLSGLDNVDGFILKSRSPSCGIRDTKIFAKVEKSSPIGKGSGLFAGEVLSRFPGLAIEDEARLSNLRIREHFLTKLYTLTRFRIISGTPRMNRLVKFHADHKLLFMTYSQTRMRLMGKIVANLEKREVGPVYDDYREHLYLLMSHAPKYTSHVNALMHAFGYFKNDLATKEKQYFLRELDRYRDHKVPLSAVTAVLKTWLSRFEKPYLDSQIYFEPFPAELVDLSDTGRGRLE